MRTHWLIKKDNVIYWQKIAVDDEGESIFSKPVIIKCRWDQVSKEQQTEDVVNMETESNTIYPDRVLEVGSYIMLGGHNILDSLTETEVNNPRLIRKARSIKSQSIAFELGWEQLEVKPGFMSEHITIECRT